MSVQATPGQPTKFVDVLGVHVSPIDPPTAVEVISRYIRDRGRTYICVTGVHGVMECQRDEHLTAIHNEAALVVPDGMPIVWASRWAGMPTTKRVYGPDLMLALSEQAVKQDWRIYLYGGRAEVLEQLQRVLKARFPGLRIAGTYSPPFREMTFVESGASIERINNSEADLVFVGLSTPKQEKWMGSVRSSLDAPVLVGVGAAFDMLSGNLKQAPTWMQQAGLEWLFRLAVEPRRLWRRYLKSNPLFIWQILRHPPAASSHGKPI